MKQKNKRKLKPFSDKTIHATIKQKMDKWISTLPIELKTEVQKSIIVTGGCIPSMMLGEKVNDYDVYFNNLKTLEKITLYYIQQFTDLNSESVMMIHKKTSKEDRCTIIDTLYPESSEMSNMKSQDSFELDYNDITQTVGIYIPSNGVAKETFSAKDDKKSENEKKRKTKFRPVFLSENAITLSDNIQMVIRFWGEPQVIHKNYDFVHATNYWTYDEGVVMNLPAAEAIRLKQLKYIGSKYPLSSIIRMNKFQKRKWVVSTVETTKILFNLNDFDLYDKTTLKDQLTGVDLQYFEIFFKKISAGEDITYDYLIKVMDEVIV